MNMAAEAAPQINPLNPLLYSLLEHKFGEVRIANAGAPANVQRYVDPLRPGRTVKRGQWGEYYCVCCPFCQDQRHRLWINHTYGADVANGRRTDTHLAVCYNADCVAKAGRMEQLEDIVFGPNKRLIPRAPIRAAPIVVTHKTIESPGEVVGVQSLPDYHPAVEYLQSRNFDVAELDTVFKVGVCINANNARFKIMQGRIYIPIYFNSQLIGWQGRIVGPGNKYSPKYYNAPGTPKSQMLYNYDVARSQPVVVVVEGVPSVWRLGVAGVCIFGKTLSVWQQNTIATTWHGKPVFVMLDNDAQEELERAVTQLISRNVTVVPVILPDSRDPADYTRKDLFEILSAAAEAVDVTADLSFLL